MVLLLLLLLLLLLYRTNNLKNKISQIFQIILLYRTVQSMFQEIFLEEIKTSRVYYELF